MIFATQQPYRHRLGLVVATIIGQRSGDMGDYAAAIARTLLRMGEEPLLKPLVDMPRMAEMTRDAARRAGTLTWPAMAPPPASGRA